MAVTRHPLIAREGWIIIGLVAVLALLLHYFFGLWATPLWLVVGFLMWLYRDPYRIIPPSPLGIVSPVDGRICTVDETRDPYLDRDAIKVSICMFRSGTFSLRSVTEGKVMQQWRNHGENENGSEHSLAIWLQTDEKDDLVMVLTRCGRLSRLASYLTSGQRIGQGQRFGFAMFGNNVDVYIPLKARVTVKENDKITAGTDIISELVHS